MNLNFADRLDIVLDQMLEREAQDASGNGMLAESSDEFAELVQLAAFLRTAPQPKPSAAGMQRGQARLLAELSELQQQWAAGALVRLSWQARLMALLRGFSPSTPGTRSMVLVVTMLLALTFGSMAAFASVSSLPGDWLYSVKLLREQVALAVTLDESARAALAAQDEQTRVQELARVEQMGRVAQIEVGGTLEQVSGNMIVLQGFALRMNPDAPFASTLHVGDQVRVLVQTYSNGTAEVVRLIARIPAPVIADDILNVQRTPQAVVAVTPAATLTRIVTPTATLQPDNTPARNFTLQPSVLFNPVSTPLPNPLPALNRTAEPPANPAPVVGQSRSATVLASATASAPGNPPSREVPPPSPTPAANAGVQAQATSNPSATTSSGFAAPSATSRVAETRAPTETARSSATGDATRTAQLTATPLPSVTQKPSATPAPSETHHPEPTGTRPPEATRTRLPDPTQTVEATQTRQPDPTQTPRPTQAQAPEPTRTLQPQPTHPPEPTETRRPAPTNTRPPQPTETRRPEPTQTPHPSNTSEPPRTREPTQTPHPSNTPEAAHTREPTTNIAE